MVSNLVKYAVISIVFIVAAGIVAWFVLKEAPEEADGPPGEVPVNVVVTVVEKAPLPDAILLPASVEAYKSVTVSAEVAGKIEWLGVEEGRRVEVGTAIARIDTSTLQADVDKAASAYRLAQSNFKRGERLFSEKAVSEDEFDRRKSQLEVAEALYASARIRFEKGGIAAPAAGILNRRYIELGEYVNVGDPIADIVQIDRVKVVIDVPEKEITYVEVGELFAILSDVEIDGDAGAPELPEPFASLVAKSLPEGRKLSIGAVTYRSVVAAPATRTYRVEVTLANPDLALLPGRIVRAVLLRRIIADAISVPLRAVVPREGRAIVFVENGGRAREVEVELGITDGRNIQVLSGLEAGDMLVIEGQRQLRDGQAVAVREPIS